MKVNRTHSRTSASESFNILSISPLADDHATLGLMLRPTALEPRPQSTFEILSALTLSTALRSLKEHICPVAICERDLTLGSWKDLLEYVQYLENPPLVIIVSRDADDRLWAEALNLGAYDVLAKPFDQAEIVRVVASAWAKWFRDNQTVARPTRNSQTVKRIATVY